MRVRIPIDTKQNHSALDDQLKIMKIYRKFKNLNDENVDHENKTSEPDEYFSNYEILGVTKPNHPCLDEKLVEKQACGMKNKKCEHEIFGIPGKYSLESWKITYYSKFYSILFT